MTAVDTNGLRIEYEEIGDSDRPADRAEYLDQMVRIRRRLSSPSYFDENYVRGKAVQQPSLARLGPANPLMQRTRRQVPDSGSCPPDCQWWLAPGQFAKTVRLVLFCLP
jgi:hypothetical protein